MTFLIRSIELVSELQHSDMVQFQMSQETEINMLNEKAKKSKKRN